ncbi:hypothetical protein B1A_03984, partial [mine drainage metagenome]
FTLHAESVRFESCENIRSILLKIKDKFGIPSGAISDMRSGYCNPLEMYSPEFP